MLLFVTVDLPLSSAEQVALVELLLINVVALVTDLLFKGPVAKHGRAEMASRRMIVRQAANGF